MEVGGEGRKGKGDWVVLKGGGGKKVKGDDVEFGLGKVMCVRGVWGRGKWSLINDRVEGIVWEELYGWVEDGLGYERIEGVE